MIKTGYLYKSVIPGDLYKNIIKHNPGRRIEKNWYPTKSEKCTSPKIRYRWPVVKPENIHGAPLVSILSLFLVQPLLSTSSK